MLVALRMLVASSASDLSMGTVSPLEDVPSLLLNGNVPTWLGRHGARSLETLSCKLFEELHKGEPARL